MYNKKEDEIRNSVWSKLIKAEGIPIGSNAAVDLAHETEDAINTAIMVTAQAIFEEILNRQKTNPAAQHSGLFEDKKYNFITVEDVVKIEDEWLHDACNFCQTRLPSVIRRKDGKRICARCEAVQPYTYTEEEIIHGKGMKSCK